MHNNNPKQPAVFVQGNQIKATGQKPSAQAKPQHPAPNPHPTQNQQAQKPVNQPKQNSKPASNTQPQQPKQAAPKQPQQQQQQQQQAHVVQQEQKLQVTRTIKLQQMLTAMTEDKDNKKISFIVDKTGNAYVFFKYKGTIIDVSEMMITEHTAGKKHEENLETARKSIVTSLNIGDNLVFSTDITCTNQNEFFKSGWYMPESIFNYDEIINPKYFREHLLKPEEDHDGFGNKGNFYPKDTLNIALLFTAKEEAAFDLDEHLTKLGLQNLKNHFVVTLIEQ